MSPPSTGARASAVSSAPLIIPVFAPLLEREERQAADAALENGWLGMGAYVGEFEADLERFLELEGRRVVAVSTGHAALHLSFLLMGIGGGDEVITPSFNNIADFQALMACGASPVFCDVRDDDLCIDLEKAEELVSERTKAILAIDYGPHIADHDRVERFAARHGLRVVHDAAHAFGSRHSGRMIGSFSDVTTFSFDPVKTITCIDGGAIVVRTEEEVDLLRQMRLIGMGQPADVMYENRRAWTYDVSTIGFRYHLANLHAAIGTAQLAKMPRISENRRRYAAYYEERFRGLSGIVTCGPLAVDTTPFSYYLRVDAERRDDLREHLRVSGIDTGIHWQPGHWFSFFAGCRHGDLSVTDRVGREIFTLPMHSDMDQGALERVADVVVEYCSS